MEMGEFSREDGFTTGSDSEVETVARQTERRRELRPLPQPSNWAKVTSSTSASAVKP